MAKPEEVQSCAVCGATIYPEHLKKKVADYLQGRLLCGHCLHEKRAIFAVNPAATFKDDKPAEDEEEPIALALDDDDSSGSGMTGSVQAFGPAGSRSGSTAIGAPAMTRTFRRPLLENSPNATRCRTFHCKLTDSSLVNLNDMINEWADANPGVEVKFATSCIGPFEAKSSVDQHLIVTVFY